MNESSPIPSECRLIGVFSPCLPPYNVHACSVRLSSLHAKLREKKDFPNCVVPQRSGDIYLRGKRRKDKEASNRIHEWHISYQYHLFLYLFGILFSRQNSNIKDNN